MTALPPSQSGDPGAAHRVMPGGMPGFTPGLWHPGSTPMTCSASQVTLRAVIKATYVYVPCRALAS